MVFNEIIACRTRPRFSGIDCITPFCATSLQPYTPAHYAAHRKQPPEISLLGRWSLAFRMDHVP